MTAHRARHIRGKVDILPTAGALEIGFDRSPIFTREEDDFWVRCYGSVYNVETLGAADFTAMTDERIVELAKSLAGWFCLLHHDRARGITRLVNDIFANARLYCCRDRDRLIVSDDWRVPADRIREYRSALEICDHEREYFGRHRYTTGGHTLVSGLDKLLPATLLRADHSGCAARTYFRPIDHKTVDEPEYMFRNYNLLMSNMLQGMKPDLPTVLMFSGGIDSTFLACCLMDNGTYFRPLFIKYDPPDRDNVVDGHKAATVAEHLGLNLDVIKIPIARHLDFVDRVVERAPFDKALAVPLEYTFERLAKLYGPCNVINGQSSDSIYCWGASGKTFGCLIQRLLASDFYTDRALPVRALIATAVGAIYRRRWNMPTAYRVPCRDEEYWLGLLDPQGYVPINLTAPEHRAFHDYLMGIVRPLAATLKHDHEALRIYMKLMYLQGPTNIQPIETARAHGHNLILPFVDGRLVQLRREFQAEWRNLRHPRYVLEETLRERFGFDPEVIDRCRKATTSDRDCSDYAELEREIYEQWDQVFARLL